MNFSQFALAKFGNFVKRHNNYLIIRGKLRSAHIFKPYEEYVSEALIVSLIVAISGLIIGLVVGIILAGRINIPPMLVYDPDVARILNIFSPFKKYTLIALVGIVGSAFLGGIVYTIFMIYPSSRQASEK